MTISKERLNEIALEVAKEIYGPFNFSSQRLNLNDFALALIRRVENELSFEYTPMHELLSQSNQLVTLPLVKE